MRRVAVSAFLVVLASGCTGQLTLPRENPGMGGSTVGSSGGGGGGGGAAGSGGTPGQGGRNGNGGSGGAMPVCTPVNMNATQRKADLLFLVGRNSSMSTPLGDNMTRMEAVRASLQTVLQLEYAVNFGYVEFPGSHGCSGTQCCADSQTVIKPAPGLAAAIVQKLQQCNGSSACVSDFDSRPVSDAFQTADAVLSSLGPNVNSQYAILLVDDSPSCGSDDPSISCSAATDKLNELSRDDVTTFVVTVGQDAEQIPCLRDIAIRGSSTMPYQGHNPAQLTFSLSQIVSGVAAQACTLFLPSAPMDNKKVSVRVGNVSIPFDLTGREGWNYGNQQSTVINVSGNSCKTLQQATRFKEIQVTSGCPP